jgi:hypothetical protein
MLVLPELPWLCLYSRTSTHHRILHVLDRPKINSEHIVSSFTSHVPCAVYSLWPAMVG